MQNDAPQTDTLYQAYSRGLYKITGEETYDNIINAIGSNPTENNSTMVNVPTDILGSGQGVGITNVTGGGIESGKQKWTSPEPGFFLGIDTDGIAKLNIGDATKYLKWDGTSLVITTTILVAAIDIPDTISANSFHVDTSGNAWWGATALGSAVASILNTGAANGVSIGALLALGNVRHESAQGRNE